MNDFFVTRDIFVLFGNILSKQCVSELDSEYRNGHNLWKFEALVPPAVSEAIPSWLLQSGARNIQVSSIFCLTRQLCICSSCPLSSSGKDLQSKLRL